MSSERDPPAVSRGLLRFPWLHVMLRDVVGVALVPIEHRVQYTRALAQERTAGGIARSEDPVRTVSMGRAIGSTGGADQSSSFKAASWPASYLDAGRREPAATLGPRSEPPPQGRAHPGLHHRVWLRRGAAIRELPRGGGLTGWGSPVLLRSALRSVGQLRQRG